MTIQTSFAQKKDINEIAGVFFKSGITKTIEEGSENIEEEMKKGDNYIIAKDESGKILGFISGKTEGRPRHGLYELYHIGVDSEAQGKGIGKILFETLVSEVKKMYISKGFFLRKLYLKTGEKNEKAHHFYEKMGMTQKDSLRAHFANDKKELIYDMFFDSGGKSIKL
ncbi:GNAT family N-acetyltransferase [Candidatus Gracilibacteria bacterium]|nr:GNAT family N-acetyltransferase [Candidatus Gracilibacteria bacterium]NUJ98730.1 GNAT family N-acetyltransferase [Candidatus Gracilibacteria bacterium]